jgi:hypothetical protein
MIRGRLVLQNALSGLDIFHLPASKEGFGIRDVVEEKKRGTRLPVVGSTHLAIVRRV